MKGCKEKIHFLAYLAHKSLCGENEIKDGGSTRRPFISSCQLVEFSNRLAWMSFILSSDAPPSDRWPKIALGTRKNAHIDNNQCMDPVSPLDLQSIENLERRYAGMLTRRNGPTAMYNCHGLSFASRRTRITEDKPIRLVLSDDCYEDVRVSAVLPGDLLLYVSVQSGDIRHSALVVSKPDDQFGYPMVVSKWGSGPEYIHRAHQCTYFEGATLVYYRVKS